MKRIIWKAYYNFETEEKWLNELASKGLAMTDYSWCRYVLEDTPPGEYIYRIELLDHTASHPESQRYIAFVEETGAEFVASYMRWVYFRKKAADGPFELFSDNTSRITHYRKVRTFWFVFLVIELIAFAMNLAVGLIPPFFDAAYYAGDTARRTVRHIPGTGVAAHAAYPQAQARAKDHRGVKKDGAPAFCGRVFACCMLLYGIQYKYISSAKQ